MMSARWFIRSDDNQPHLAGWMNTAIKTEPTGGRDNDGWLALAICPQCHALVLSEETHAFGDQKDAHELWHAATDHPVPENLREVEA